MERAERLNNNKRIIYMFSLILLVYFNGQAPGEFGISIASWRPVEVLLIEEGFNADNIPARWSYDESDADDLLKIALFIDGRLATDTLISYIDNYHDIYGKGRPNPGWARAVYCLGLVQTDGARDYLLNLWNEYDKGIGDGSIQIEPRLLLRLNPLSPITDAMHFYLFDETIREIFQNSIAEINDNEQIQGDNYLIVSLRKTARNQMAKALVRWEIIETPGGPPFVKPQFIIRDFIVKPSLPRDIEASHSRLIDWVSSLPKIECGSTREWRNTTGNVWQNSINDLVSALDEDYALKIYQSYLGEEAPEKIESKNITVRLWILILGNYLSKLTLEPFNSLENPEIMESLSGASDYFAEGEEGYVAEIGIRMLYTISMYVRDREEIAVREWQERVRDIAEGRLEENDRQSIKNRVDMFLQRHRRE